MRITVRTYLCRLNRFLIKDMAFPGSVFKAKNI
jgi:hypothetical protein